MMNLDTFCPEGKLLNTPANIKKMSSPISLAEAQAKGDILEGVVLMCDAEHNLIVDLGCMKGIIPRNEGAIGIEDGTVRDIALITRVGKPVSFIINKIRTGSSGKLYAELSRLGAQTKCLEQFLSLKPNGSVIDAKVTHLENFGAFCDIGCGIIALLPIDAISVSRISHPKDRFAVGDDIKVIIKSVANDGRITLSHKELLGNWQENAENFKEGQTVSGIVRSVESYGVFVELSPNLAGLAEPKEGAEPGMQTSVYIKSIIPEKMKVKLIIIDSFWGERVNTVKYFFNNDYMDIWRYSPENCHKNIFTDFTAQ